MRLELLFERYQGTFSKMPNLTAMANKKATITAQVSSESEVPLLAWGVVDVSVDIGISPLIRTMKSGYLDLTFRAPVLRSETRRRD
jgi:hypothetical protein